MRDSILLVPDGGLGIPSLCVVTLHLLIVHLLEVPELCIKLVHAGVLSRVGSTLLVAMVRPILRASYDLARVSIRVDAILIPSRKGLGLILEAYLFVPVFLVASRSAVPYWIFVVAKSPDRVALIYLVTGSSKPYLVSKS